MNVEQALEFLSARQPMLATSALTEAEIDQYDSARKTFLETPDIRCVPLFLNSFGEGDAHGVYQLVGDVIRKHESGAVLPHLKKALKSERRSIRYWCAQISGFFPEQELVPELVELLQEPDVDVRSASATALSDIQGGAVSIALRAALTRETDEELREMLEDIIDQRGSNFIKPA